MQRIHGFGLLSAGGGGGLTVQGFGVQVSVDTNMLKDFSGLQYQASLGLRYPGSCRIPDINRRAL